MPVITSRTHTLVKTGRALARGDAHRVLLDGWHLVAEALAAGLPLDTLAVRAGDHDTAARALCEHAARSGTAVVEVSAAVMDALSPVRTPSGAVAFAARPISDVRRLLEPPPALVVAALGVQDPGNVGAIVRSATAGGATGVLFDEDSADPWGWKALRASMGSTFRLPVSREADAVARIAAWRTAGLTIVATDPDEGQSLYEADLRSPAVIAVGAEGAGLPRAVIEAADRRVRIPMRTGVESLNVAVATALIVYEATRQRA